MPNAPVSVSCGTEGAYDDILDGARPRVSGVTNHAPNVLLVGPDAVVDRALRTVLELCRQPSTLILRDVGTLSLNDQHRLMAWLEEPCGRTQIIATNARALYPCVVDDGAFLKDL